METMRRTALETEWVRRMMAQYLLRTSSLQRAVLTFLLAHTAFRTLIADSNAHKHILPSAEAHSQSPKRLQE